MRNAGGISYVYVRRRQQENVSTSLDMTRKPTNARSPITASRLHRLPHRLLSHCRRFRWRRENSILLVETKTVAPVRRVQPKPLRRDRRLGIPCIKRPSEASSLFPGGD